MFRGIARRSSRLFHNEYRSYNISAAKLKYLKHLPPGKQRTHSMLKGVLHYTSAQEFLHTLKELFINEIYKVELPSNPYIIDCGANIGLSILYIKRQYPNAEVLAFEPDSTNFKLLEKNIRSFQLSNIELEPKAVWKENTTLSFANEGSMGSRIDTSASENKVDAVRLKDYLNRKVDFLKIDIEGAEYEVIRDIAPNLNFVQNLFLEYHGSFKQNHELIEMLSIITHSGFQFYIKEAANVYAHPFLYRQSQIDKPYDVQLNIFCTRPQTVQG